ncbi:hypothetical protein [uncultured Pseudomonas sp.]|uniref:beta strand repeat-containing protein n=1 Tax=uncultured Pseudomonas sp. TaxID=114707 RepID=UPI0025886950|nr:hypothetical protein [uncultured Pseudomonas sp.]
MAVTANQVQSLYLAYFGRPAEQAGLTYWTAQTNATVDQISAAFAQQPEYSNVYGSLNRVQTIQELYTNLFNRTATDTEINYWNASQDITVDRLALALVNGATGNDSVTLSNKVGISQVLTAQAGANASAQTLTTAGNNAGFGTTFTGSSSQSASQQAALQFTNTRETLVNQTQFSINGDNVVNGNGATAGSAANAPALSFFSATTGTLNATNAGVASIVLPSDSAVTALTVNGTVGDATGATANASTLTFTETLGANETATVLTSLNLGLTNSAVAPTVTTINANGIDSLTTIDGSASSAALTINTTGAGDTTPVTGAGAVGTSLANLTTLNGGSGNDVLTVSTVAASAGQTVAALTVNGGAGADQITGTTGSAALTINAGDGADTVTLTTTGATAASTVNLGAGNDVINLAAGAFGTGTSHAVSIDLGAGNDTLNVTTLANLHAGETTAQLTQDLIKVANFGAGDKLSVSGLDSYQALSSTGATNVASASNLLAAVTAAISDVNGAGPTAHTTSFQYGGNTYIVHADATAGITAGDGVIELTGYQGNFVATAGAAAGNFTAA